MRQRGSQRRPRQPPTDDQHRAVTCARARSLAATMPVERIGEPVRRVTLAAPTWTAATANRPAYCRVDGVIDPVDTAPTARPINFCVALPAQWSRRAAQLGGGGMNGTIPNLTGGGGPGSPSLLARGFVTYGSDSGHQAGDSVAAVVPEEPAGAAARRRDGRPRVAQALRRRAPEQVGRVARDVRRAPRAGGPGPPATTGRSTTRRSPTSATCR